MIRSTTLMVLLLFSFAAPTSVSAQKGKASVERERGERGHPLEGRSRGKDAPIERIFLFPFLFLAKPVIFW